MGCPAGPSADIVARDQKLFLELSFIVSYQKNVSSTFFGLLYFFVAGSSLSSSQSTTKCTTINSLPGLLSSFLINQREKRGEMKTPSYIEFL